MATAFVRGSGGGLLEMDIPTSGHALERWEEALRKGDLSIVPSAEWVTLDDGSRHLVVTDTADKAPVTEEGQKAKTQKAKTPATDEAPKAIEE